MLRRFLCLVGLATILWGCEKTASRPTASIVEEFDFPVTKHLEQYRLAYPGEEVRYSVEKSGGRVLATIHATADDRAAAEFEASKVVFFVMNARVEELESKPIFPSREELEEHAKEIQQYEIQVEALQKKAGNHEPMKLSPPKQQ